MAKKIDYKMELLNEAEKMGLCIKFMHKSGGVTIYQWLGDFECPEQAYHAVQKWKRDAEQQSDV